MKQFNGYYGCSWCREEGTCVDGTVKYVYTGQQAPDRTHGRVVEAMRRAKGPEEPFEGFKGPSSLVKFKGLDLVWGLPPDYMHSILEGVTKQLADFGRRPGVAGGVADGSRRAPRADAIGVAAAGRLRIGRRSPALAGGRFGGRFGGGRAALSRRCRRRRGFAGVGLPLSALPLGFLGSRLVDVADALKTLALGFLGSRLVGVTRAPSPFSNAIGVLDSRLVGVVVVPLPTLAFGFPGSRLVGVAGATSPFANAIGFANPRNAGDGPG
ncbi:hypothetical protein MTO96_002248 [Rhipicephalus appendiculatus]